MAKTYVLDTSVMLSDYNALYSFPGDEVIIPMTVLKELDGKKKGCDEVARNARESIRILESIAKVGGLKNGVLLENGTLIRVIPDKKPKRALNETLTKDDKIINAAVWVKDNEGKDVTLITEDINMRVIANVVDIPSDSLCKVEKIASKEEIYNGHAEIILEDYDLIDYFHKQEYIDLDMIDGNFFPNQFITLKCGNHSALGIVDWKHKQVRKMAETKKLYSCSDFGDIIPKNREQKFAANLLLNKEIELVTISGEAGTGKSIICLAACLRLLKEGVYDRIIITKPMVPIGRYGEIGFLPGDKMDKISPWMGSIYDNLRCILGDDMIIEQMINMKQIEFEALSLFRGRSLPKSIILVDESQNLSKIEAKTLVTRVGTGSKIILNGDLQQIDTPYVDSMSNGLTHVIEKMKDETLSGHITLIKGERSTLATIAAKKL